MMRRALELLIVAAALALGGFVAFRLLARTAPGRTQAGDAMLHPGTDQQDPRKPAGPPDSPAVQGVPMIKLTHPPQRRQRSLSVPVPSVP